MSLPNYKKYTIEELYESLSSITENDFPERVRIIKQEIEKRKKSLANLKEEKNLDTGAKFNKFEFYRFIIRFKRISFVLQIISFLFGLSVFINYFANIRINTFAYEFGLSFPGFLKLSGNVRAYISTIIVIVLHSSFLVGAIGSFLKKRIFEMLLAGVWGTMTIGFEFWAFRWWPTPLYDIPISLSFDLFGLAIGFKLNLITLFFALWASVIIPEFRREIVS